MLPVSRVISGGQTGVDRAALDWAIASDVLHGGWCPKERRAEDGPIPARYQLTETEGHGYHARTVRNVRDGDATLILNLGDLQGGSLETMLIAQRQGKPVRVLQLDARLTDPELAEVREWLRLIAVYTLNVAGPRESKRPGIYEMASALFERLFPNPG